MLFAAVSTRRIFYSRSQAEQKTHTPSLTVIVAAYNEASCIEQKIQNCLELAYPPGQCWFIFVTDGSVDETPVIVGRYPQIQLLHRPERQGKVAAIHRAMQEVDTELVVFTDANTLLNTEALLYISRHYTDPRIGAVAGEKKVKTDAASGATAGEGWYWQYESTLKQWESELYTVMGAAGELFSIRTALYRQPPADTLLDDFFLSSGIAMMGYKVHYDPNAFALEAASQTIAAEWKRKIRIAAGGVQMCSRSGSLLSFQRPLLSFAYISHRVLRWVVAPYMLIVVCIISLLWEFMYGADGYIHGVFIAQVIWYTVAAAGWLLQQGRVKAGWLFVPFYFCMMNAAMIAGMLRYISGRQTVLWEKSRW